MAASIARDVEEAKSGKGLKAPAAAPGAAPSIAPSMSDKQILALFEPGSYEVIPHDGMRRTIAQRLTASVQTVPHFYLTMDCDIGKLLAAREEINASAPKDKEKKPLYKLSVNDFVIKAMAIALQRIPNANVSWTESGMLKHKHSDIGVAVAMPGGLITPIIRKAETKSLSTISAEMKDFAARARARKLKPEEYQGGTTAVSNLGMYGIKDFTAVINPPHATILAVGTSEERAVVRGGKIEAAHIMSVTLSCDHRAVDGALGAELIGAFKMLIENPCDDDGVRENKRCRMRLFFLSRGGGRHQSDISGWKIGGTADLWRTGEGDASTGTEAEASLCQTCAPMRQTPRWRFGACFVLVAWQV